MPAGDRRPVVVTGLGCVSPLGAGVEDTWEGLCAGRSGVRALDGEAFEGLPVRLAGTAPEELELGDVPAKEARRYDRAVTLAVAAAREAMEDAGLAAGGFESERAGCLIGTGIGGVGTLLENHEAFRSGGPRRVSPFFIPMTLANMSTGVVAIRYGLRGPSLCTVTACAASAHALGEAARLVERGDADLVVAGGTEAAVLPLVIAGFARMQALSTRQEDPGAASRPFDADRDGFVLAEGAAVLVLEAEAHARARGARVRAELAGFGVSADALHLAAPDPEAGGARRCMEAALRDADLAPADVGYVNAHATSTPLGDRVEAEALREVLGAHAERVAVSSTKGATGHLLGAAGALEALVCVRALEEGRLPPTLNLDRPDPACALDHVRGKARVQGTRVALSNSFGFGGVNAALVLRR